MLLSKIRKRLNAPEPESRFEQAFIIQKYRCLNDSEFRINGQVIDEKGNILDNRIWYVYRNEEKRSFETEDHYDLVRKLFKERDVRVTEIIEEEGTDE